MCGIVGLMSRNAVAAEDLQRMTDRLRHRGPDAQSIHLSEDHRIGLGHTRLSIIDLSTAANQPFASADGRYVIVFNGEVYNFQAVRQELITHHQKHFRTTSDTEVIVEAFSVWGAGMARKLEGMFALAILDQQQGKLFLLRDRLGKKPLYYYLSDRLFAFASEIKSLLTHPEVAANSKMNRAVVSTFAHLGYIPEPHTIYESIRKFPSGHYGEISSDFRLKVTSYWNIDEALERPLVRDGAKEGLATLLDDAVQKRLISDVPLGAFLSGGTDSSLVTALAARHVSKRLKTFAIGFQESKYDESRYARAVAQHLNTDHTEYILSEQEAMGLLEAYVHHFDEPFADTSAIPTMLVSKLARKEVTVALTGDGGDELFHGYGSYAWANRLASLPWKMIRQPAGVALRTWGNSRLARIGKLLGPSTPGNIRSHIFSQEQYFFTQREEQDQLFKNKADFHPFRYSETTAAAQKMSAAERQALFDLHYYLKDDLLVKVDRASMYYGLECRCPLLDHRVVEYAFTLDETLKSRNGTTKWLLKELLREHLPANMVDRPKWGFSIPLIKWMKQDLRYLLDDHLDAKTIEEVGLFNVQYVQQLKTDFLKGKDFLYNRLWVIIVLHKWWKENQA